AGQSLERRVRIGERGRRLGGDAGVGQRRTRKGLHHSGKRLVLQRAVGLRRLRQGLVQAVCGGLQRRRRRAAVEQGREVVQRGLVLLDGKDTVRHRAVRQQGLERRVVLRRERHLRVRRDAGVGQRHFPAGDRPVGARQCLEPRIGRAERRRRDVGDAGVLEGQRPVVHGAVGGGDQRREAGRIL